VQSKLLTAFISLALCSLAFSAAAQVAGQAIVNFGDVRQRIDGFGAADVWDAALTDAQADMFFSQTNGIGLSILRQGISSSGGSLSQSSNAVKASQRGAIVWAAPWSAPGAWKDNGSTSNGGHLLTADYNAWATSLATYASNMQAAGVPLYAISVQNEPDYVASYDSMIYTPAQMTSFINVLGPKLAALNPRPKLIMPEVSSWGNAWSFESAVLADPTAPSYFDILGVHQYAGFTAPQSTARPIWETEQSSFEAFDPSILNGIGVARWIHDALVTGGVSAWHYWWLIGLNTDDEGLIGYSGNTTITKRLYAVGNFSKFVRPGYMMVGVSSATPNVSVSAFKNPSTGDFVVVAINQNGADTPITLTLNGLTATSVTPWVTSSTLNLAAQTNLAITGGNVTTTLPAYSVTSFVSSGASAPPSDTTPPSVPSGLGATAVSSSQINLTWTASTDNVGVSGYRVYRGGALIGTTSGVTYGDTGLQPSSTYSYAVAAFDAAGNVSAQSGTASATTQAGTSTQPPGTPSALAPTNGATTVGTMPTLTWSAAGATAYYVGFGRSNPPGQVSANQSAASYVPGTLSANTTYYWQITAVNSSGATGGPVWSFTTGTGAGTPPSTPSAPTPAAAATAVGLTPTLTWTATGATTYDVAIGTTNTPATVSTNQTAASYTYRPTLAVNTTYYWQITAHNANGTTVGPVWSFTTLLIAPPAAPVGVTIIR
jgi:glucuronoarabinoxylan endo-1,4-beta-xylanase